MHRRTFLKIASAGSAAAMIDFREILATQRAPAEQHFRLHPFIEAHPESVFVMKTTVADKLNIEEKLQAGRDFAARVFSMSDSGGIPLTHRIALKPNLTCTGGTGGSADGMGIRTDMPFLEGLLEGMKDIGIPMDKVHMREGNWLGDGFCPQESLVGGTAGIASRTGIHLLDLPSGRSMQEVTFETLEDEEVQWRDCPDGVIFKRIGYIHPFNMDETWILNIAKFKSHSNALSGVRRILQGSDQNSPGPVSV